MTNKEINQYDVTGKLVIDYRAREWCLLPYGKSFDENGKVIRKKDGTIKYDHPDGCPNYGNKADCPDQAPLIEDFIDLEKNHWFIVVEFDIGAHERKQKKKYPHWSKKQCRNSRHWQNGVVARLLEACRMFCRGYGFVFTDRPEAMGVHVIKSAKALGISIRSRPKDTIFKIALIGYPKNRTNTLDEWI